MIDIFGKVALTSCAIFMLGLLVNFFVKDYPTADRVNAIIGGANIVVSVVCTFVYVIAKIWGEI
jgi:hypothetical protein